MEPCCSYRLLMRQLLLLLNINRFHLTILHRPPMPRGGNTCSMRIDRALPPDFLLLPLNKLNGSFGRRSSLVPKNQNSRLSAEVTVQVLKSTACCFWVEEVDNRDKAKVKDGPNNVELPPQVLDSDGGDLDDPVGLLAEGYM